jgi:hypothetical protein
MATRTISNLGGNYNSTATWVEGVVPTSADDIAATATSGQLTVNVASAARNVNFTNYTNTLTMNNTLSLSGTGFTNTFVSGMTITGSSNIAITNTCTIISNGLTIPNLSITGTITLGDDLNVVNLINGTVIVNGGGYNINISGNTGNSFNAITNGLNGTLTINYVGTNQNLRSNFTSNTNASAPQFTINYLGVQYNENGSGTGLQLTAGNSTTRSVVNYISGSFSTGFTFYMSTDTNGWELNFGSASNAGINNFFLRGNLTTSRLILLSDLPVNNLASVEISADNVTTIAGTGSIISKNTSICGSYLNSTGRMLSRSFTLNLTPGATHSFGSLTMLGVADYNAIIKSTITDGDKAAFSVGNTQSIYRASFTDCEVVGSSLNVIDTSLLRTTNIVQLPQYYYSESGGGTGSAGGNFVFFS